MRIIPILALLVVVGFAKTFLKSSPPPPPPFDVPGGVTFIRNGNLYTPTPAGKLDVVMSGTKILSLLPPSQTDSLINSLKQSGIVTKVVDVAGSYVVPGLIDVHVHAAGSGGELGPYSRTPEGGLSTIIEAGITTLIGLLGTDGVTRDVRTVVQKLNSLEHDGLTTFMWTGAYRVPVPTFTGDVQADITLIDKVIGVGELAISDHRSSWPSYDELVRIVSDARVAGMLAGKAGVVHFHVGSAPTMLDLLWQIVNETTIPITNMYPTHMSSRGPQLLNEAKKWILAGGFCDFTADDDNETETVDALVSFDQQGLPLNRLSVSSDAFGSAPIYDSNGNLLSYGVGQPDTDLKTIQTLVLQKKWPLEKALQFNTINPATFLNLTGKGTLAPQNDGDVLVLSSTLQPVYVFGKGDVLLTPTWVKKSMFEN